MTPQGSEVGIATIFLSTAMSLACVQGSAMSLVTGLENLERATTYDRNKRANTSGSRDFLSAYGVAAA